jgi:hypothetical protein
MIVPLQSTIEMVGIYKMSRVLSRERCRKRGMDFVSRRWWLCSSEVTFRDFHYMVRLEGNV